MKDYDYLLDMSKNITEVFTYGTKDADIIGNVEKSEPFLHVHITRGLLGTISTQLVGDYNLPNILAAVAVGKYFKVQDEKIKSSIEAYTPSNSRSQLIEEGTNKIILDAYNANPSSMKAAIENFANLHADSKVLMLGGMAELGEESLNEHKAIIALLDQHKWNKVVLVGGDFLTINHPYISFEKSMQAKEWFLKQHFQHTTILIKGSRSMQMEKVLQI